MKKLILMELLRKASGNPQFQRNFKRLAIFGVVGILIATSLIIWAGVSAVSFVTSKATQAMHSDVALSYVGDVEEKIKDFSKAQASNCWQKAQSLVAIQPWVDNTIGQNLISLKAACSAAGNQTKTSLQSTDGGTI